MKSMLILIFLLGSCSNEPENKVVSLARKVRELQVSGIISGFDCATVNIPCPEEHSDHHETLGLMDEEKDDFSFIVNVPQTFLKQYFREPMQIEGKIFNGVKNAVEPKSIRILNKEGKLITVFIEGEFIDEVNHKSTFENGEIYKGKWYCKSCAEHLKEDSNF